MSVGRIRPPAYRGWMAGVEPATLTLLEYRSTFIH